MLLEQEQNKHIVKGNWAASRKPVNVKGGVAEKKHDEEVAIIWQEFFSDSGETYYYNPNTQESTWDYPKAQGCKW